MRAPKLIKSLMWNMTYHAEHHAYPAVPFHSLPDLHEAIASELKHKEENHRQFHRGVIRKIFK